MRNFLKDFCVPGGGSQKFKQQPDLTICGQKYGLACQSRSTKEKQQWATGKTKLDNARKLRASTLSIQMKESLRKPVKSTEKVGDSDGCGYVLLAEDEQASQQAAGNRQHALGC